MKFHIGCTKVYPTTNTVFHEADLVYYKLIKKYNLK